jgi:3-methyladenine DNA glycosylase AlkD
LTDIRSTRKRIAKDLPVARETAKETPARLAARALVLLSRAGTRERAARSRSYFKPHETVRFYGVATPQVRVFARQLSAGVRGTWTLKEAVDLCDRLVRRQRMESKTLGFSVLSKFHRQFDETLIARSKTWLSAGHCGNWAAVDDLCGSILGPLLRARPDLIPRVTPWSSSTNLWMRRASLVSLVPLARRGMALDEAYATATRLLGDDDDLIHKAGGWLLREAGRTDPARLEAYLRANGPRVHRTTLRYAIERFPAELRRDLLAATRGSPAAR